MAKPSTLLLRLTLGANFLLTAGSGLAALLFTAGLLDLVGAFPGWLVMSVGAGLLVFSVGIASTLLRLRIGHALIISVLDLLWVVATVPLTLVPGLLTREGTVLVLVVAVAVGALALLQLLGIRALLRGDAKPGEYRHCVRLRSSAEPGKLWRVIRDLGGIARYSAGLRTSFIEGGREVVPGVVRVCTNRRGQSWAEEVLRLDDRARSVDLRFRSEAQDFPFPLEALTGGWAVTPGPENGAYIDVWWNVTPKQRRLGWFVVALMTIPLDRDLPQIVGAMEAAAMDRPSRDALRASAFGYC